LRLGWSVADQKGHTIPTREDIEVALQLREGMDLLL